MNTHEPAHEVRIANRATYWPIAPLDLLVGAPLVARLLLRAGPMATVVQAAALGLYATSALSDWRDRRALRPIDFRREFGADVHHLAALPSNVLVDHVERLAARLNRDHARPRRSRRETAAAVDAHLTRYIAAITGQRVRTSVEVRGFTLARLAWPSALGVCDVLSGDVAIFRDTGPFEPHVVAHEFSHRKGYWKELHAQVLAYLALATSGDPALRQAARCERLYRSLRVLAGEDPQTYRRLVRDCRLRPPLERAMLAHRVPSRPGAHALDAAMRRLYDARMRLTGQNGVSDYDAGFLRFLYTFESGATARQTPPDL